MTLKINRVPFKHLIMHYNTNLLRTNEENVMVFNATFNNISAISLLSVLLVEETGGPGENHRPAEGQ